MPTAKRTKKAEPRVCRLTLTIMGTAYTVRPAQVDGASRAYILQREGSEPHTITAGPGADRCTCEAFAYRKAGATCKHLSAARACGLL